ncbi:phosphomethylpyrimidine synthase ThiC [bacterium]|nr:phosphomethylpyrimidine synthase ThiC [bacterium]
MTQLREAKKGNVTAEMLYVAECENIPTEILMNDIACGHTVILKNNRHKAIKPLGIGKGLRTKINANLGTSKDKCDSSYELEKLRAATDAGADTVMDLSTGGDIDAMLRLIMAHSVIPVGSVPIYQAVVDCVNKKKQAMVYMTSDDIFESILRHADAGVDFVTVHCGVTKESISRYEKQGRLLDVVSRGGSFLAEWMRFNKKENPLYEEYDRLIEIAYEYDLVLSLGDGMRPGCLKDASDRGMIQELIILGELAKRAFDKDVQVMIEGPGHVPMDQITANVIMQKKLCNGAPFYVLGPIVTDIAPGYDHITSAIGGAIAASAGADYLCYVTPSEHLRLPTTEDVREGVIASKIAAHAADIAKGIRGAMDKDIAMAESRKNLDWKAQIELSLDPARAKELRESSKPEDENVCTMCADFCAIKVLADGKKGV